MIHVGDVMRACRNYFIVEQIHKPWEITDGMLSPALSAKPGDWIAVTDSLRNNGVYQLNHDGSIPGATDETFTGNVYRLAPPKAFLDMCEAIAAYDAAHPVSPVQSEKFGPYSQTLAAGASGGWEAAFSVALIPWRCMFAEVIL